MSPSRRFIPGLLFGAFLILNALVYLHGTGGQGFPLDDAWIHQTFARGLAEQGRLAFQAGEASTGSTAPLWSALLALGRIGRGLPVEIWAYVLGSGFAWGAALLTWRLARRWLGAGWLAILAGLIYLLDWHTAWAALSGMEITLATFLALLFFVGLEERADPAGLGAAVGVLVWVRPEGILLAGIYALVLLAEAGRDWRRVLRAGLRFGLPFALLAGLLFVYNFEITGRLFQSTVYAKYLQWSYPWTPAKALAYIWEALLNFLAGPLAIPVLFLPVGAALSLRQRDPRRMAAPVWVVGLVLFYAISLPSLYHHGRYLMPLIPLIVVLGLAGLESAAGCFKRWGLFWRIVRGMIAVMGIALWINGAASYTLEVNLLTRNHQDVALWLRQNTPTDAVVATHDIGIIGYFSERKIFDLAGLVSPEAQDYLRDPAGLARLCRQRGVAYLAIFSGYYPDLLANLPVRKVYSPAGAAELSSLSLAPFEVYEVSVH